MDVGKAARLGEARRGSGVHDLPDRGAAKPGGADRTTEITIITIIIRIKQLNK